MRQILGKSDEVPCVRNMYSYDSRHGFIARAYTDADRATIFLTKEGAQGLPLVLPRKVRLLISLRQYEGVHWTLFISIDPDIKNVILTSYSSNESLYGCTCNMNRTGLYLNGRGRPYCEKCEGGFVEGQAVDATKSLRIS